VVRAAEAYEHYGCPLLSLVILKHWGYVMPVDHSSRKTRGVRNILEVRRDSIASLPRSTSMSFMGAGGLRTSESANNIDSGRINFDDFASNKRSREATITESPVSNGMSLMGGFKSSAPPSNADIGTFDFDSFGGPKKQQNGGPLDAPKTTSMSFMGGFKSSEPAPEVGSGLLDFDSFGSTNKKQNGSPGPTLTGMSLMGGLKPTASNGNVDSGMLDFDSFGSMSKKPVSKGQAKDIFADFAPPSDDGLQNVAKDAKDISANEDKVRGTEELLNDYITTLVVQLLTVRKHQSHHPRLFAELILLIAVAVCHYSLWHQPCERFHSSLSCW